MTYNMEGKDNHFFFAGLTVLIGSLIQITLMVILNYSVIFAENSYSIAIGYAISSEFIRSVIAILFNIFFFIAFTNLDTKIDLINPNDTTTVTKLILGQILLLILIIIATGTSFIYIFGQYMLIVAGIAYILLGIVGFLTFIFISKLINKQQSDALEKLVSRIFIVYSITFLLDKIFYGIFSLGIDGLYNFIQPLMQAFESLNAMVSIAIALILILFSIKLSKTNVGILIPKPQVTKGNLVIQCLSCGHNLENDEQFCVNCGKKVE